MAKLAIKIRPDVAFAASGRIFLYVGTQQMLRQDAANATSGRIFSRVVACF